jgi:hypothetical protein
MKSKPKLSKMKFYLALFAASTTVSLLAAYYYGRPSYPGAVLMAFSATAGAGTAAELVGALIKRWHR